MVMEDNEYGQSVTLAAVPVSTSKCVLLHSVSGLSMSRCCLLHRAVGTVCFYLSISIVKTCEPTPDTDTKTFHFGWTLIIMF